MTLESLELRCSPDVPPDLLIVSDEVVHQEGLGHQASILDQPVDSRLTQAHILGTFPE